MHNLFFWALLLLCAAMIVLGGLGVWQAGGADGMLIDAVRSVAPHFFDPDPFDIVMPVLFLGAGVSFACSVIRTAVRSR